VFEIEVEGTFEQSPDHVFDYLADFRNMPGWNQDVLSTEKTSPGPVSVGTTFSSKVKKVGRIDSEFVSFERPTHFSVVDRARGMENRFDFRFTPSDVGVKLSLHLRMEPRGPLRLLEPVLRPTMRRQLAHLPEQMKRGLETAGQSHPG
jgi:uncharacterized protein YndB with AHSA1/START domain